MVLFASWANRVYHSSILGGETHAMSTTIVDLCQQINDETLNSVDELNRALATILEAVRACLGVIGVSVWLIDPVTGELICQQAAGPGNDTLCGWRLAPGIGIAGWVVGRGQSLIVSDAWTDSRHFRGVYWRTRVEVRSILSLPLAVEGKVIGTLQVVDPAVERFTPADRRLVAPLADALAGAFHRAQKPS